MQSLAIQALSSYLEVTKFKMACSQLKLHSVAHRSRPKHFRVWKNYTYSLHYVAVLRNGPDRQDSDRIRVPLNAALV
jgi:hypothetical protein